MLLNAKCMRGIAFYQCIKSQPLPRAYSEPCQLIKPSIIFENGSILDVWQDSEFVSALHDYNICL